MEKEFEKFIKRAKQITLSPDEKKKIRENLTLFMERHPVKEEAPTRPQLQKGSWILYQLRLKPMPVFAVIAVITLMVGGGTSLAAESALPGDALYPVKVSVNEEVRGAFAISDEAKARLAANLAERRLQEAATLAAGGKLTVEAQAEIESRFNAHVEKFEEKANKLAAKGKANAAAELSSNLEVSLRVHSQILGNFAVETEAETEADADTDTRVEIRPLIKAIKIRIDTVEKTRANAETKVSAGLALDVEAAAEGKLKAVTNKIAEARRTIERTRGSVHASATAEAEATLKLAEEAMTEGKTELEADKFAKAFISFDRAHRLAQEAHLLINAAQRFKVNLNDNNSGKYGGCPTPRPGMPNWVCSDGSVSGPACEDGRWVIKQCPSSVGTSTETETENETRGEGKFRLKFEF
ncbi:MAG: DUF5667 domain-containing protein [Candidatus Colwellbacteria bacterium]|nr:DUF5667 domain-containing protein [Candidatus Colwellbacteria bacterium]